MDATFQFCDREHSIDISAEVTGFFTHLDGIGHRADICQGNRRCARSALEKQNAGYCRRS
jgi:hypothetical protein